VAYADRDDASFREDQLMSSKRQRLGGFEIICEGPALRALVERAE
jgi:hypothetical protein